MPNETVIKVYDMTDMSNNHITVVCVGINYPNNLSYSLYCRYTRCGLIFFSSAS